MEISRRGLLSAFAAPLALSAQSRKKRLPNIIWIMADDLGYADVGCYGQKIIRTPNIDRLAVEGMRFTQAYAGCTVCAPSRSVLMTGRHMGHTSVRSNPGGVPILDSDVTVAEMLKTAGYATGGFGKWGLGDIKTEGAPIRQGFDEFYGYQHQAHAHYYYPGVLIDNDQEVPLDGNTPGRKGTYSHDAIADRALAFIRKHKDQPFFCYMPFTIPHTELEVPEDSKAAYREVVKEGPPQGKPNDRLEYQKEPYATYAGMVSRLDRDVGRVVSLLSELKLDSDTIIFFTSDNGGATRLWNDREYFNSYAGLRGHKQNLYEGGIRVPMIARWTGKIRAGSVSDFVWMFEDFFPTAAELAGVRNLPSGLDGFSVLPVLLGRKQKPHESLYWELPRWDSKTGEFRKELPMAAMRMGDWKAVRPKPDAPLELYNLAEDPFEKTDLAPQRKDLVSKFEAKMRDSRVEPRRQQEPPHRWWQTKY